MGGARICARVCCVAISTVIVDDEKPARDELNYLLEGFQDIAVVGEAANGLEAFTLIQSKAPDLVFLDVQMPGLDGFGLLRELVENNIPLPHVIFATAFDQYAVQAFDVNAVDYLLKPFDKGRLEKAVERARSALETKEGPAGKIESLLNQLGEPRPARPAKLMLKSQQRLIIVDSADVVYATIEDGVISIFTRDSEGASTYHTLEELQAKLDPSCFWRAHRSYVVNINHIKEVLPWFKSTYQLRMNDKRASEIPVSRNQTRRLRELFKL